MIVSQTLVALARLATEEEVGRGNAYNKSVSSEGESQDRKESGYACTGLFTSTAGGVRQGLHIHTEKTEFRFAKGSQGTADERL